MAVVLYYRGELWRRNKFLVLITGYALGCELFFVVLASSQINTLGLSSLVPLLDFLVCMLALAGLMKGPLWTRPVLVLSVGYFICAAVECNLYLLERSYPVTDTYGNLLRIGICLYAFYDLTEHPQGADLLRVPLFYFNTGLLVYSSGTLFLFAMMNQLMHVFSLSWLLHAPLSIFFYYMLAKSMVCLVQTKS